MAGRRGKLILRMDGRWDIEDLLDLSEALKYTYGYFYAVSRIGQDDNQRIERLLADHFWRGDSTQWYLQKRLYDAIPDEDSLKIVSIRYSSPGFLEIAGLLSAFILAGKVANLWLDATLKLVTVYEKIDKFFERRKHLRKPKRNTSIDAELALDVDAARILMFEIGDAMGYSPSECAKILDMLSNPIAGLKFMVALANETRKISNLVEKGLLSLPNPPTEEPSDQNLFR